MGWLLFLILVTAAGLGGYALLIRLGLDDLEAWAGGRTAGLVGVVLPAWWLGVAGFEKWRGVGLVLIVASGVVGAVVVWRRRARWREIAKAEIIFIVGVVVVLFIRLDHPQIAGQEKPMDMGIFSILLRTPGFPPIDMWLAGEAFPYYYWGALIWTVPITFSGLPLDFAYNLVVALIGGLVFSALWVLGRGLSGSQTGGALAAFFGLFAGTPDGLRQLFAGVDPRHLDIWKSSRQHEDLITEFPLFTAWLGDLHPHLLSMPIACLAFLVAWKAGRDGVRPGSIGALAVLFGVVWSANPWAMPPTLAGIALLLLSGDGVWHWPTAAGWRRWLAVAGVAVGGWLVTAPFHLAFVPFFRGIGTVSAWTAPATLMLYAGSLLIPAFAAGGALLWSRAGDDPERRHAVVLGAAAVIIMSAAASRRPTLVLLVALLLALGMWVLSRGERSERPAVALAMLGVFLFLVPEILFVEDGYGERLHRMNTVFKSYIQAWIFLALALPVLARFCAPRKIWRAVLVAAIVLPTLPHLVWMGLNQVSDRPLGLDGLAWMSAGDRAIVDYLRDQPSGTSIIEAVGGPYSEYARLSANSGVPAYLGWENHELVWRGQDITEMTGSRRTLVQEVYTCGDPNRIRELVGEAGVNFVAIGSLERKDHPGEALAAVREAGEVVVDVEGGTLVRFPSLQERNGGGDG